MAGAPGAALSEGVACVRVARVRAERNACTGLFSSEERAMKKDDHQKGHSRKNTANIGGAAYAPQQDEPHSKGDERAPNKPIGEAAYASRDPTKKKTRKT